MAQRVHSASSDFTTLLTPAFDRNRLDPQDDGVLHLMQSWALALIVHYNKVELLPAHSSIRRLLQVGSPDYWYGRHDDPIDYEDDQERGAEADQRRHRRRANELLQAATHKAQSFVPKLSHPLFFNVKALGDLLGLTSTDRVVLCFLVLLQGNPVFQKGVRTLNIRLGSEADCVDMFTVTTDCDREALRCSMRRNGPLRSMGLLKLASDASDMEDYMELPNGLGALMMDAHDSAESLVRHFFTPRAESALDTSYFPHLAEEIAVVVGIFRAAMRQRVPGTNVLLYGPPGVGKTELAAVVAQALQASLYEVGYSDDDGDPIRGTERLSAYALCQRMLSRRSDAVVLFDEVEDMLEEGETPGKAWVNRSLEENPVPAIWITNHADALDPAYRRRFDYSVRVTTPPRAVRLQIARHHLKNVLCAPGTDAATEVTDNAWLHGLAANPSITPAQMERAAKVAQLVETSALANNDTASAQQRVLQVLGRSTKLLGQPKLRPGRAMATAYDLAYLHTDTSIPALVESLRLSPSGSFCFYGPPGAGKTALARYIAQELELPMVLRRASDLLDCYLGGTEKLIAEMFEAARTEPSVLILDEADSFLQSRANAHRSWEVQQVNEFLTQMEEHEGLFICTTNLLDKLDPASLRRFDWKVAFKPMTASQRWALFLQEFHLLGGDMQAAEPLQAAVRQRLNGITPGDFAPVTRQYRLLRRTPTPQEMFERLHAEILTKEGRSAELTQNLNTAHYSIAAQNNALAT